MGDREATALVLILALLVVATYAAEGVIRLWRRFRGDDEPMA